MRGRHSNQENFGSEGVVRDDNLPQVVEEPHLSGAYLRNLVKQHLGSSRVFDRPHKSPTNHQTLEESQRAQPPKPSKCRKQVRRRFSIIRPDEEDLLDMTVARREIATALRLHRAQNSDNHPPQPQPKPKSKSKKESKIHDFNTTLNFSNNLDTLSYQSFPHLPPQTSHSWSICAPASPPIPENFSYQSFPYEPPQTSHSWLICASASPPIPENFNLPNQTSGLNLNLQDFDDLDTTLFHNNCIPARCDLSKSPSTSNSPSLSVAREETPYVGLSQAPLVEDPDVKEDLGLHHAVDDEEMAEIRSVGEQHQIEWDDTITSAWWFNYLNTIENDTNRFGMEFPPWLNTNDNSFQQLDEHNSSDHSQAPALPQMDFVEIEGMDGEWLI